MGLFFYMETAGRCLTIVGGLILLYAAVFLYEGDRKRIQNHLEDWWLRVSELKHASIPLRTVFLKQLAHLTDQILDRIFGKRFISIQAVSVSLALTVVSISCTIRACYIAYYGFSHGWWLDFQEGWGYLFILAPIFIICFPRYSRWVAWVNILVFACGTPILMMANNFSWTDALLAILIFILSFVADVLFIAFTRWVIQLSARLNSFVRICLLIGANMSVAFALCVAPVWWSDPRLFFMTETETFVGFFGGSNFLAAAVSLLFVLLGGVLLLHLVFWPLLARLLYPVANDKIVLNRKLLGSTGIALLLIGAKPVADILTNIFPWAK